MQILYGVKITDRVTVKPVLAVKSGASGWVAYFDGERISDTVYPDGQAAAKGALTWLRERAEKREQLRQHELVTEAMIQRAEDDEFLHETGRKLGVDMDRLIEVIARRMR